MINKLLKNWIFLLSLLVIVLAFFLSYIFPDLWIREGFSNDFFKGGFYFCGFFSALWLLQNHVILFSKEKCLRSLIICVGAATVFLWTYKHKITFRMDLLLLFLCGFYSLVYRKWIMPDRVMIVFFLLIILRFLGILWTEDKSFAWEDVNTDKLYFLLFAFITCIGFRTKEQESMSFITLCFKLFLLLLTLNISAYIFIQKAINLHFFSFLAFNKGYMNYYELLLGWSIFKHPSFIAWIMLVIWGLGVLVWRKNKELISLPEVILYGVLLFCFVFMLQARVAIIGFPLCLLILGWFYISKEWTIRKRIITEIGLFSMGLLGIYWLVTHTTFFADSAREKMFIKAKESINNHFIIGAGTSYEKLLAKETIGLVHIHNDFLATFIDLGIVGFSLLLLWIFTIYQKGIYNKDNYIIYCLMIFLLFMNTDVILNYQPGVFILLPFLIFIFFKQEKTLNLYYNKG